MVLHSDQVSLLRFDYLYVFIVLTEPLKVEDVIPWEVSHLATEVDLNLATVDADDLTSAHCIYYFTSQFVTDFLHSLVLHRPHVNQCIMKLKNPASI